MILQMKWFQVEVEIEKKELKWKNKILGIFNWTASFSSWSKEDSLTFDFLAFLLKFIW